MCLQRSLETLLMFLFVASATGSTDAAVANALIAVGQ
jgi:hypothetical protein